MALEKIVGRGVTNSYGTRDLVPADKARIYTATQKENPLDLASISPGLSTLVRRHWDRKPGFVIVGDSTAARQNKQFTVTSITAYGNIATVTATSHGMPKGQNFVVNNANQSEYNGIFSVREVLTANTFTYVLPSSPKVLTATGTIVIESQGHVFEDNWSVMSSFLGGGKGLYLGNFAWGGSRTSALDAQLDLALNTENNLYGRDIDFVFISSGINDIINNVSVDTIKENLLAAVERIIAANAVPFINTMMPMDDTYVSFTTARVQASRTVNTWIRETLPLYGAIVVDASEVMLDLADQHGNWKSGYSIDGLHPQKIASLQLAKELKTLLWDNITVEEDRDLVSIGPNSTLEGTGGSVSGTGASGDVADGFTLTATGGASITLVGSKGISLSGNGESQRISVQADAADTAKLTFASIHGSLSPGDKVIAKLRLRTETADLTGMRFISVDSESVISGVTNSITTTAVGYNNYSSINLGEKFDLFVETPPFIVPEGVTSFYFTVYIHFQALSGTIEFDISDYDVYKVK